MDRRRDLDSAKGLAILFVVFGHLVAHADPAGVHWYEPLRRAVYAFHMPFFLYLSGIAAALSGTALTPPAAWRRLLRSRARRLLIPFFGLGVFIVLGKILAARIMFVDNRPHDLIAGFTGLVWHTADSPVLSIWYLFVLFVVTLLTPLILRADPSRLPALVLLCLVLYAMPLPAYVYLDRFGRYAIFFALGATAGLSMDRWSAVVDRAWPSCFVVFVVALTAIAGFGASWPQAVLLLPIGIISMPALHGLVRSLPLSSANVLFTIGRYSFMIYLFNTICIGVAKGVLLHFLSWSMPDFLPLAAALMTAGTIGPVVLKRYAFAYIKPLDRLTD